MGDERGDAWRREWEAQQGLQNQLNPIGQGHPYNQQPGQLVWSSLDPYQQPPGYSPLSEADVRRIADAVVARLRAALATPPSSEPNAP